MAMRGEEKWYVLIAEQDAVIYAPGDQSECQRVAAEVDEDVEEADPVLVSRNGLVALEEAGGKDFEYGEHATSPSEVDGGVMGELLDAVFRDSADKAGDGDE